MRKNITKVVDAFLQGKPARGDSRGSCSTDGNVIYSYALAIARRDPETGNVTAIEPSPGLTVTTRSQVRAVHFLLFCREGHEDCAKSQALSHACRTRARIVVGAAMVLLSLATLCGSARAEGRKDARHPPMVSACSVDARGELVGCGPVRRLEGSPAKSAPRLPGKGAKVAP